MIDKIIASIKEYAQGIISLSIMLPIIVASLVWLVLVLHVFYNVATWTWNLW